MRETGRRRVIPPGDLVDVVARVPARLRTGSLPVWASTSPTRVQHHLRFSGPCSAQNPMALRPRRVHAGHGGTEVSVRGQMVATDSAHPARSTGFATPGREAP